MGFIIKFYVLQYPMEKPDKYPSINLFVEKRKKKEEIN